MNPDKKKTTVKKQVSKKITKKTPAKKKESALQKLQEKVTLKKESVWAHTSEAEHKQIFSFAEKYKRFLSENKTEREMALSIIEELEKKGFKDITKVKKAKTGDKVYKNVAGKSVLAFVVGKKMENLRIVGAHLDSPRLDLKPHPLYEDSEVALLQTHYYGGIKKYHWVNTPLALHGVMFTKEGKKVHIRYGDNPGDPVFIIPDLLPHLAQNQMERKANKIIEGEELNIIVGHIPVKDKKIQEKVKMNVLKHLHDKFGIIEEDFTTAEIELVPANNPVDIGFDRGLIAAYGQDDKVCAYTTLQALKEIKTPKHTAVGFFVDKEEIGSMGNTGAASLILQNFVEDYRRVTGQDIAVSSIFEGSLSISADVTAGMDPNFKDVNDPQNASYLGRGVSVEKYGGGGGKYGTHDASAEYMQYLRALMDKNKVRWQTGELGRIDLGGGGTIGMYMSRYGMECVDAGPCVLSMHSPYEVASKADVYQAYLLYKTFMNA